MYCTLVFIAVILSVFFPPIFSRSNVNRSQLSWEALTKVFSTSTPGIYWNDLPEHPKRRKAFLWSQTMVMRAMLENLASGGVEVFLDAHSALQSYKVETRGYAGYSPILNHAKDQHRFWDDNGVTGLIFAQAARAIELRNLTQELVGQIDEIWPFIQSGMDKDEGGEFWFELDPQPNRGICSTASTSQLALERLLLGMEVSDSHILTDVDLLEFAKKNLEWMDTHLFNSETSLYWNSWYENIADVPESCKTGSHICNWMFTYNQGYVIHVLVRLFEVTGDGAYLTSAAENARASLIYFNPDVLWRQPPAFNAIYFRALLALDEHRHDEKYLEMMREYLDKAWGEARDQQGLIKEAGIGMYESGQFGVIDQSAFVQMFAVVDSRS